jgi:hypothetical protein
MENIETINKVQNCIARAHHYLNLVAQDTTIHASILLEDADFVNLLTQHAQGNDDMLAYSALMDYANNNW